MIVLSVEPILKREYGHTGDHKVRLFLQLRVQCWACKSERYVTHYGGAVVDEHFLLAPGNDIERLISMVQSQHDSRGIKGQPRNQMCLSCGVVSMIPNEPDLLNACLEVITIQRLLDALEKLKADKGIAKTISCYFVDHDGKVSLGLYHLHMHLGGVN